MDLSLPLGQDIRNSLNKVCPKKKKKKEFNILDLRPGLGP